MPYWITPLNLLLYQELRGLIQHLGKKMLSKTEQKIVRLCQHEGYSSAQVAEMFGTTMHSISSSHYVAKKKLQTGLQRYGYAID
jgi:DNA-directed RNA polymerase specialized sigma24 family protein